MFNDSINKYCKKYDLDPHLVTALIATESGFNPLVIRYEEDYRYLYKLPEIRVSVGCTLSTMRTMQKTSWGLMQIMGAVYYELGGTNWATILLQPDINIKFGCEYLAKIIKKQNLVYAGDIYAAYNSGAVRKMRSGQLVNQKNVDRFLKKFSITF